MHSMKGLGRTIQIDYENRFVMPVFNFLQEIKNKYIHPTEKTKFFYKLEKHCHKKVE